MNESTDLPTGGDARESLIAYLIERLLDERSAAGAAEVLGADHERAAPWDTFRALVNIRPPWSADEAFLTAQDTLLRGEIERAGIKTAADLSATPRDGRLKLWRGDITLLAIDAIVNAANDRLLGCWLPNHYCIDNAIHTFAGVQLRLACNEIMERQGYPEPTGQAKSTPAFNLPSRFVLHTVGPIVAGAAPTSAQQAQLARCYTSCLDEAARIGVRSVAFCGISTGVFGYPSAAAAPLAVHTVKEWLDAHPDAMDYVVFDVFGENDEGVYREALGRAGF